MKGEGVPELIEGNNSGLNERSPGLFGMPLRQTTGFVQSLLRLVGSDFCTEPPPTELVRLLLSAGRFSNSYRSCRG